MFTGGVYHIKQHIARIKGNVAPCGKSTPVDQVKCKQALEAVKKRKDAKRETLEEVMSGVNISANSKIADDEVVEIDGVRNKSTFTWYNGSVREDNISFRK